MRASSSHVLGKMDAFICLKLCSVRRMVLGMLKSPPSNNTEEIKCPSVLKQYSSQGNCPAVI